MNQLRCALTLRALMLLTLPSAGWAQTCGPSPVAPCVQAVQVGQPIVIHGVDGDVFTVWVTPAGKSTPASATVSSDGLIFTATPDKPLAAGDVVVVQRTPKGVPATLFGSFTIPKTAETCPASGEATGLCIVQPQAGDTNVSGQFAHPSSNVKIAITVNHCESCVDGAQTLDAKAGTFSQVVQTLNTYDTVQVTATGGVTGTIDIPVVAANSQTTNSSLYMLGLVGIDSTSTSSSGPSQQFFAEFEAMAPLAWCSSKKQQTYSLQHRCWLWVSPRLASAPAADGTTISSLSSPTSLTSGIGGQTLTEISQTFDLHAGFEYNPFGAWNGAQIGFGNSWSRTSVSLIAGGGFETPFNSTTSAQYYSLNANVATQFQQNPALVAQYPQLAQALCNNAKQYVSGTSAYACPGTASSATTVAFLPPDRSRLYRDFFGGLRIRTFYFTGDCKMPKLQSPGCKVTQYYPGTMDIRFGEDETVTAGHMVPLVMTLSGSYPLPGTKNAVRVFGELYTRLARSKTSPALVMVPTTAPSGGIGDSSVVVQSVMPPDQDYFRLGLGIDLVSLISKWVAGNSPSN